MNDIPEGQLARAAVVGSAAFKLGIDRLQNKAKKSFGKEAHNQDELDEESARVLFNALTKLRGTALKLAQMLGMESELLPSSFRQELAKSYHQVPPLNRVLVRKVMVQEFGIAPDKLFAEFHTKAFAAASLGQVHLARINRDTDEVAVKIQYPGIHIAMENDIKLLRKFAVGLPNKNITRLSIDEIHARLVEELDYELEARNTNWFRQNIEIDGIEVPTVHVDYSTERVLTTQMLQGQHLDQWLQTDPSQDLRNQVGQRLYDLFAYSVTKLKRIHADPNPGNYLFRDDGTIGLIDFGCTRHLSDRFTSNLPVLLKAYCDNNPQQLRAAYSAIGMDLGKNGSDEYEQILKPFGNWLTRPLAAESFDFKEQSDYTSSGREQIHRLSKLQDVDAIAEEFIYFDRTVYGLCKILERLQATVAMRHHWGL